MENMTGVNGFTAFKKLFYYHKVGTVPVTLLLSELTVFKFKKYNMTINGVYNLPRYRYFANYLFSDLKKNVC